MHISRLASVQAGKAGIDYADKSAFLWISVIRLPDFVPRKKEKAGLLVGGIPACGDAEIWENFQKFPPLYRRVRIDTIQIKKKQPELFQRRLQKLLDNTKAGIMYGEWNDNGRLVTD